MSQSILDLANNANAQQNPLAMHQLLKSQANQADTLSMMGMAQFHQGNPAVALEWLNKALALNPKKAPIWYNKGVVSQSLQQIPDAITSFSKAVELNLSDNKALGEIGEFANKHHQFGLASRSFGQLIERQPDNLTAYFGLCHSLAQQQLFEQAIERCEQAIKRFSEQIYFYLVKCDCLKATGRHAEAVQVYEQILAINADYPEVLALLITSKTKIGDWHNLSILIDTLLQKLDQGIPVAAPFYLLLSADAPKQQLFCAQSYAERNHYHEKPLGNFLIDYAKQADSRIKIAYLSADFHNHATAILMAELFELHDKERFEVYAYSYGSNIQDEWRSRLVNAFEHFYEVSSWSDEAIARHIHEQQISIAVDLKGYTAGTRPNILAYRPAPVQVSYIGYPGTMGVSFIDYILADETLIPQALEGFYSECVIKMPHTYQPNDRNRTIAEQTITRQDVGLPADGFVFCCFNNPFKILPDTFASWMRILHAVPNSVLWLLQDSPQIMDNLRQHATQAGIDPERLIFAGRVPIAEHLARHSLADLFLDTLPYNAHTTTSDALWTGLPVLTLIGQSFAARVAASLLHACELDELITTTQAEYEQLAIELATDTQRLDTIKQKLLANRHTCGLFDTPRYARDLEAAYEHMFAQARQGKSPQTFCVKDIKTDSQTH